VADGGLRLVASAGPSLPGAPPDPLVYQAACIEAYQASQTARGFSPVTIGNGTPNTANPGSSAPGPFPPVDMAEHQASAGRRARS